MLYVNESGTQFPTRNVWGYFNGTNLYINSGDKYYNPTKRQNTFYFAGTKGVERKERRDILYTFLFDVATNQEENIPRSAKS